MRRAALAVALAAILLLAGCTPTVALTPAPDATSTGCAGVIVRMPQVVGTAQRRSTDAQGTAAWGEPAAVVLRCGVRTPVASTARCYTVGGVDWLLEDRTSGGRAVRVLTTFGRDPGVQVVVTTGGASANDALLALSDPIAAATRQRDERCTAVPSETPTP